MLKGTVYNENQQKKSLEARLITHLLSSSALLLRDMMQPLVVVITACTVLAMQLSHNNISKFLAADFARVTHILI